MPDIDHDPLAALMGKAQAGDGRAYDALLRAILPELRGFARRRLFDAAEAEDAVQDTLLAVHALRHTFDPGRPFRPWLRAIAHRRVIDRLRRGGPRRRHEVALGVVEAAGSLPAAPPAAEAAVLAGQLRRAVAALPPAQAAALALGRLADRPLAEVGRATGRSEGAVKIAAHRGVLALRRALLGRAA
jgi:RNA polymerase sigma-70 factor (ECF subfamily)